MHFFTNNIDGEAKIYDGGSGGGQSEESPNDYVIYISNSQTSTKIINTSNLAWKKLYYMYVDDVKLTQQEIDNLYFNTNGYMDLEPGEHKIQFRIKDSSDGAGEYRRIFEGLEITKVIIPEVERYLYEYEFASCNKLEEIEYKSTKLYYELPSGVFYNCPLIKSVDLPANTLVISNNAYERSGIETANIPEGVQMLGVGAFANCASLKTVVIPNYISQIDGGCFIYCTNLTSITINSTDVPTLNKQTITDDQGDLQVNNAFDYTNNCPIYVPAASVDAYKAATNWSKYASRIQAISSE